MKVLVLGAQEDSGDYMTYCSAHGITPLFFKPPVVALDDLAAARQQLVASTRGEVALRGVADVVSFHDTYQVQAELLRAEIGRPGRDVAALRVLTDKVLFKALLPVRDAVARYLSFPLDTSAAQALAAMGERLSFPVVLKPSNGFYSAGVVRVDDAKGFAKAFVTTKRVCSVLRTSRGDSQVLVEEYLSGEEYAVDGFLSAGRVFPLLFHRKRPPLIGPTFHETAYLTEPFEPDRGSAYTRHIEQVAAATGLDDSPFHAEFRFSGDGRLHVLEIAPRLSGGGATSQHLLGICTGLDAYRTLHELGREPIAPQPRHHRVGLEYDVSAEHSGFLRNVAAAIEVCRRHSATAVIQHRKDGQFVLAPPHNFETVLTAFFECGSLEQAQSQLDVLCESCVIETGME